MNLTIHRGANEIGGTCIQIESGGARIVIDAGLPLVDEFGAEFTGEPESVLPGIPGMFQPGEDKPLALLLTHAHMDHFGLLCFADTDIPVFASEGTKRLIGITSVFSSQKYDSRRIQSVKPWEPFSFGPFRLTPYLVDHSAFDAFAWLVEAEGKKVMYSGDIRAHGRKQILFDNLVKHGPRNLDALLLEGTTLDRPAPEFISEEDVENTMARLCVETQGLVVAFSSGQNIDRIVSLFKAARRSNRELVIDIYVAHVLSTICDLANIPVAEMDGVHVFYPFYLSKRLAKLGKEEWLFKFQLEKISSEELRKTPRRFLMLMRPSMDFDIDKRLNMHGAQAVWSMWSGYLDKSQSGRIQTVLQKHGVTLSSIHYGGHAEKDDLKRLVTAISPKIVVPIHTFHADKYSLLFPTVHRLEDGKPLIL